MKFGAQGVGYQCIVSVLLRLIPSGLSSEQLHNEGLCKKVEHFLKIRIKIASKPSYITPTQV